DPTGVPLVLLHGFGPEGNFTWTRILPLLESERSLIMPELLGMGFSERVLDPTDAYTHQGRSRDLAELLDQLEIEQVDLVGASYGGGVSAQFALDYPERVRRLVFLDAQVFGTGGGFFEALGNLPWGIGRAMTWFALGMGPVSQQMLTGGCADSGFCPTEGEMAERNGRASVIGTVDALRAMSETAVSTRLPHDLPQITQPTLVIWGENDNIIPPEQGRQLADTIPNAQLEMISDAGHSPHMDQPEITAHKLISFLNQ
ncbi:MAG: alpha/beta hydrolase, partial [Chloroflexi bacterium]